MTTSVLLMGANQGDPLKMFSAVAEFLHSDGIEIEAFSTIWCSPAWGFEGNDFLNQAIRIRTDLSSEELLHRLLAIEKRLGRIRDPLQSGYSSRFIDIDILVFGNEQRNSTELILPHPRLSMRRFALLPLAELWPDYPFPGGKTTMDLLEECTDSSVVRPLEGQK